ncbi:MAG: flagellar biosynthetic protein FliO [Oscillospiraceae bacterium]|nr:flagellar biosynthetic protein FliO [Oscillospiraceae bacterium]
MDAKSLIGNIGSVIMAILVFILILYLAYFATKKMGKRLSVRGVGNKNIKILESISVGQNKAIMIIQTAGKTLLVGMTQNEISLISELDADMLELDNEKNNSQTMEFSTAFKTVLEEKFGKKLKKTKENNDDSSKE